MARAEKKEVVKLTKPKSDGIKKISNKMKNIAEFARQYHHIIPDVDHTIEDTLKPEYWSHIAKEIKVPDRIEAIWGDNSKFAEYIVLEAGDTWVRVALIHGVIIDNKNTSDSISNPDKYEIQYKGPANLHCVIRKSDGFQVKDNLRTKQDALEWINNQGN